MPAVNAGRDPPEMLIMPPLTVHVGAYAIPPIVIVQVVKVASGVTTDGYVNSKAAPAAIALTLVYVIVYVAGVLTAFVSCVRVLVVTVAGVVSVTVTLVPVEY